MTEQNSNKQEFSEICEKLAQIGKDFEEGKGDKDAAKEIFKAFANHPMVKCIGNLPKDKFIEFGNLLIEKCNEDNDGQPEAFWRHNGVNKTRLDVLEMMWGYFGENDSEWI